MMSVVN